MENLPQSRNTDAPPFVGSSADYLGAAGASQSKDREIASLQKLVLYLSNRGLRENALRELSCKTELSRRLAPLLWHSFGIIAILLQEIVKIYPDLSPPNLTFAKSNRVCNSITLLQCVASQPDTKLLFLKAQMPLYVYPFLNTTTKSRLFELLRLASLTLIRALVKAGDTEVVNFMISTEMIHLCLRSMEMGTELSKTVKSAVVMIIVENILLDDVGLNYIWPKVERFNALVRVLGNLITSPMEQPSLRLLTCATRCYLRLSDHPRACAALRKCIPDSLRDGRFRHTLRGDTLTRNWLQRFLYNDGRVPAGSYASEVNKSLASCNS